MPARRAIIAIAAALTAGACLLAPTAASATAGPHGSDVHVAKRFAKSAYTWRAAWFSTSHTHWIGPRVKGITGAKFDRVLDHTIIGPDSDANRTNWTPRSVTLKRVTHLSSHTEKLTMVVHIVGTEKGSHASFPFTAPTTVRMHRAHGHWRATGAYLVDTYRPTRYCHNTPEATAHCSIFP